MRILQIICAALFMMCVPFAAKAEAVKYDFDKAHTQILFFVNHLGFSTSQGEFHDYDGHFIFDEAAPENSAVMVTIHTASIDMDDEKWNAHMKGDDFFDVEKFPDMIFKSTSLEKTGDNTGLLTGDLTLLGMTKPMTLDVIYNKSGKHPFSGKYVSGFSASGIITRSEFEMTYGLPLVGDEVKLMIEVEGVRTDVQTHKTEN